MRRDNLVVVSKCAPRVHAVLIGRARQRILVLHDQVIRASCGNFGSRGGCGNRGGTRAVGGPAIGNGSAVWLVGEQVHRELRPEIEHVGVVRQSFGHLHELLVQRRPEVEWPPGAHHVDVQIGHFQGCFILQPGLGDGDWFADGRSRLGDCQGVLQKVVTRYRVDRKHMEIDVVQGQGSVGVDVARQLTGPDLKPGAKSRAYFGGGGHRVGRQVALHRGDLCLNHLRGVRRVVQILLAGLPGFRIGFVRQHQIIRLHIAFDSDGHCRARRNVFRPSERVIERVHIGPTGGSVVGKQDLVVDNEFETGGPDGLGDPRVEVQVRREGSFAAIKGPAVLKSVIAGGVRVTQNGKQDGHHYGLDTQRLHLLQ